MHMKNRIFHLSLRCNGAFHIARHISAVSDTAWYTTVGMLALTLTPISFKRGTTLRDSPSWSTPARFCGQSRENRTAQRGSFRISELDSYRTRRPFRGTFDGSNVDISVLQSRYV